MPGSEQTWVARVTPAAGQSVATLLRLSLGLDVWERQADALVVAAPESRLAHVERWGTPAQYQAGLRSRSADASDDD